LWELAHVLRSQDVPIEMIAVRDPGRVMFEDSMQIAARVR